MPDKDTVGVCRIKTGWQQTVKNRSENTMTWYWILIILSAVIGPFEAMHAVNKARRNREEADRKRQEEKDTDRRTE